MNILVLLKHVPDLVEELEVAADGRDLDRSWIRYIPSEYDEHALEQAILLKEEYGGSVTAAALDIGDVDDMLFTAVAKGADTVIRLVNAQEGMSAAAAAAEYASLYRAGNYDLVLTGVHAIDDLDGPVGARLAAILDLPYVGVVSGMAVDAGVGVAHVHKEYPGGLLTVIRTQLPAVIGIQSAMKPPRYVPIARIRQASKTAAIDQVKGNTDSVSAAAIQIRELRKPDGASQARMLEGGTEEIVDQLLKLFLEQGIVR
jgi:electron transfer flavoprotein beta subunit